MILSGLDEAGLGPPLGPFCAALAEFEISDSFTENPDLYILLSNVISQNRSDTDTLPVGDSKILYSPTKGLGILESSVIAFLSAAGLQFPLSFSKLISELCPNEDAASLNSVPWFAGAEALMLPMEKGAAGEKGAAQTIRTAPPKPGNIPQRTSTDETPVPLPPTPLAAALSEKGVIFRRPTARFIPAETFNRTLAKQGGKGGAVRTLLTPLLKKALTAEKNPPETEQDLPRKNTTASRGLHAHPMSTDDTATGRPTDLKTPAQFRRRITVDRQGGRRYYGEWLTEILPGAPLRAIEEGKRRSVYTFGTTSIEFTVGADGFRMETALASMTAKYLREAAMKLFNRWWSERIPGLRPTAGYPKDAKRFLKDLAAADVLPTNRDLLIRRL